MGKISACVKPSQVLLVTLLQLAGGQMRVQPFLRHWCHRHWRVVWLAVPLAGGGFCYRACLPWHSRLEHCAGFHQSPLWQWQMLQSSTFTSMPAGIIVVPAKQFGPAKTHGSNRNNKYFFCFLNWV